MAYFDKFSKINYQDQLVVNIFDSIIMKYRELDYTNIYFKYNLKPGEKPEHVAYDFYGSETLHWILLLTNKIVDPMFDWYLSYNELVDNAKTKYNNIYETHHYEVIEAFDRFKVGDWTDSWYDEVELPDYIAINGELPHNITPISNLMYEEQLNEEKRIINVISEEHIQTIVRDFELMLSDDYIYLTEI